jgi:putative addiction module component (TIGR02574 family)
MKLAQLPQVMALSTEEKLALIDELWISIEPELDRIPVSEVEKQLLDERLAEHAAHPEDTLTLEQLKKAVAANLK